MEQLIDTDLSIVIDYVQSVVGDVVAGTDEARTQIQRPRIRIRDPQTQKIVEEVDSDVPDLLSVHGMIRSLPGRDINAARCTDTPQGPCQSLPIQFPAPA